MQLADSLLLAKSLADPSRLRILSALRSGELCAEELATLLGLAPSTVSFHLKKLVKAGLLSSRREQYYAVYSLRPEVLDRRLGDLLAFANPEEEEEQKRRRQEERQRAFEAFFTDGRLTRMPAQKRKRLVVLETFASLFERGCAYSEQAVNERIVPLFGDYCLVRRLLVDEGFMRRTRGSYTRTEKDASPALPAPPASKRDDRRQAPLDNRRKQLKRDYLLSGKRAGIFRIQNKKTGRSLLGASPDARAALNRIEFELRQGGSRYPDLLADFAESGKDGFAWEILVTVDEGLDAVESAQELDLLEEQHLAALDWENTYNPPGSLRIPPRRKG